MYFSLLWITTSFFFRDSFFYTSFDAEMSKYLRWINLKKILFWSVVDKHWHVHITLYVHKRQWMTSVVTCSWFRKKTENAASFYLQQSKNTVVYGLEKIHKCNKCCFFFLTNHDIDLIQLSIWYAYRKILRTFRNDKCRFK